MYFLIRFFSKHLMCISNMLGLLLNSRVMKMNKISLYFINLYSLSSNSYHWMAQEKQVWDR